MLKTMQQVIVLKGVPVHGAQVCSSGFIAWGGEGFKRRDRGRSNRERDREKKTD